MIGLLALSLITPLIATPVDALRQQQRCESQIEIQRLVRRCTQIHAPGFPSKRPINRVLSPTPNQPADTYTHDLLDWPIDAQTLAATFGEPAKVDREWRYPNAVQALGGTCGIAVADANPVRAIRFFKSSRPAIRPVRDVQCLDPKHVRGLQKLCAHAWFNDVERIQKHAQGSEPPSLSEDFMLSVAGIFALRTQTGVKALLREAKIRPSQLDTVFGPPKPRGTRRNYRHAPPFDSIGRTCTADAAFVNGVLYELRVDRGPQYAQPPYPSVALSASTRSAFEAIEQTCRAGASLSAKARGRLSTQLGLPAQGYPRGYIGYRSAIASLQYAELLARYGGSFAERRASYYATPRRPRFEGEHQFTVPTPEGSACTLEVVVEGMFRPVSLRRLYFRPPIKPRTPAPNP